MLQCISDVYLTQPRFGWYDWFQNIGRSSKLTHTGVEIDTCAFQTGCQLASAASGMSLELRFWRNISGVKCACWTPGSWRSCLSLEVASSIPTGSTIIHRFLCGFICDSLCQSIKIEPTNMFIACVRAQFKINTHRCWNWHLCIPDGLSVVQCSLGHVIGVAFLTQYQWREAYVLDTWQLAELPRSGGREFDPHRVHDNLSVPLWVYMRFPVPEHQN